MPKLTITKAAKAAGIARQTIYTYIKEGKLSVETIRKGGKEVRVIDTSELIRVFGELKTDGTSKTSKKTSKKKTGKVSNSKVIQVLYQRINDLEKLTEEMRKDKERSQQDKEADRQREQTLLEIIKKQQTAQIALLPDKTEKKGFFKRLFK
jgi:predicted site-specific integrase-resolvase